MPNQQTVQELQEALDVFLDGRTGIRFEALIRFAEPLFKLYQVDLRSSLEKDKAARTAEELATLVAILETARLLWGYFSLGEKERRAELDTLEKALLGGEPSGEEEHLDFLQLISVMQERWENLSPAMRRPPEQAPDSAPPSFKTLANTYDPVRISTSASSAGYGPEKLEPAEAQALFARPLLESKEVLENPDALESAMARANAYWELAQTPADQYDNRLETIKHQFADTPQEDRQIEREAEKMVSRFHDLFPQQQD